MTPILQRMVDDMRLRNLAANTQHSYLQRVSMFSRHFHRSPELIGLDEIRAYQLHLATERKLAPASIAITLAALRFLYNITLQRHWVLQDVIPTPKIPHALPHVLSPEEVLRFLESVPRHKYRVILTTCYAAGLRVSEAVNLKPADIDTQRMVIRVERDKGQNDRYVMLSPRLLDSLRNWCRIEKPQDWLFPGKCLHQPITRHAVEKACQEAHRLCQISKPVTPHSLRHAFAVHMLENRTDIRTSFNVRECVRLPILSTQASETVGTSPWHDGWKVT